MNKINRAEPNQRIPHDAKKVFSGILFDVYQWQQKQYDGSYKTFEKLRRPDTVSIVPVTADKKLIIIKQEQPGKQPIWGFPGGRVDAGEEILPAAQRELSEETGLKATEFALWEASQPVDKLDWCVITLIGKGCTKVSNQHLDAGEKIEVKEITFSQFLELLDDAEFDEPDIKRLSLSLLYKGKSNELERLLFT